MLILKTRRFLAFPGADFARLHELLIELFGNRKVFIFDEIQNIAGWERFINRMAKGKYKFYITGSNPALLSGTGHKIDRANYLPVELFPFSFDEYLRFRKIPRPNLAWLTNPEGRIQKSSPRLLTKQRYPPSLAIPQLPLAKTLYDDILNRDVAQRYKITDIKSLRGLTFYLFNNIASLISYNKLKHSSAGW